MFKSKQRQIKMFSIQMINIKRYASIQYYLPKLAAAVFRRVEQQLQTSSNPQLPVT